MAASVCTVASSSLAQTCVSTRGQPRSCAPSQRAIHRLLPGLLTGQPKLCHLPRRMPGGLATQQARSFPTVTRASVAAGAAAGIAEANEKFGIPGAISIEAGDKGLAKVVLKHDKGSQAELYLFGACVTSWTLPSGKDYLYVRPDAKFDGSKPISGGIPHCFPQFGPGAMQQHGFARNLTWELVSSSSDANPDEGEPTVELILTDNEYTRKMWDHPFKAVYQVTLKESALVCTLRVLNTGSAPFSFTAALHSYFRAASATAKVSGLTGCKSLNKDPDPVNPIAGVEARKDVTFPGFVDCMYLDTPRELFLDSGLGYTIAIQNSGWKDAVVWNPFKTMESCYKEFVCVENAQLEKTTVEPGQSWHSEMRLVHY